MIITYRDKLGIVEVVTNDIVLVFCDNYVYFTGADDNDYKIKCTDLIKISNI